MTKKHAIKLRWELDFVFEESDSPFDILEWRIRNVQREIRNLCDTLSRDCDTLNPTYPAKIFVKKMEYDLGEGF